MEEWEKGRGEGKDQNLFGDLLSFRCHVRHISKEFEWVEYINPELRENYQLSI